MSSEEAIIFACAGERLTGILHHPQGEAAGIGVLLVVGGPQTRVGSHRQFVLLARDLAAAGIAVFRFDYRGMGDSSGAPRDFEDIAEDIGCALETFLAKRPAPHGVVLWGLCDAATANAFFALEDHRIVGQVALNPWVRTVEGEAQAYIRHYYLQRLLDPGFWRKALRLQFNVIGAVRDFGHKLRLSRGVGQQAVDRDHRPLPERLRDAQLNYPGRTLLILSGQDLTAREYEARVSESAVWQAWTQSDAVTLQRLQAADHTFSRAVWRDQVSAWTRDWVLTLQRAIGRSE